MADKKTLLIVAGVGVVAVLAYVAYRLLKPIDTAVRNVNGVASAFGTVAADFGHVGVALGQGLAGNVWAAAFGPQTQSLAPPDPIVVAQMNAQSIGYDAGTVNPSDPTNQYGHAIIVQGTTPSGQKIIYPVGVL